MNVDPLSRLSPMRLTLLILAAFLVGCDGGTSTPTIVGSGNTSTQAVEPDTRRTEVVEPDTRPTFVLDASKPFVIEFGRGSGQHGLDIVKVNETGAVQLSRIEGRPNAEFASLQLSSTDVATLVGLVNTNQLTSMGRMYSDPRMADGTQWVLWIEQSPFQKSIYFNNFFPDEITAFESGLDALLQKAGSGTAMWSPLPRQQAMDQQKALWGRIEPAR
ncbi:MAG TPA: hypothetical protein VGR35_23045 [Tepidisphaeraceae bacterium]|nr:hypothetical protein [Tepidisphaeraceae bacterium]